MRIITKEEYNKYEREFLDSIEAGKLFIYPTDTIYGIGCDATNEKAVQKLRKAKQRKDTPFSVIAPSKEWIVQNCKTGHLENLPGQVTLIVELKNKKSIAPSVNSNAETLGVRIPDCWTSSIAKKLGKPIITTSVNKHGEEYATDVENVDPDIAKHVHFAINEGVIRGRPSKIINTISGEVINR